MHRALFFVALASWGCSEPTKVAADDTAAPADLVTTPTTTDAVTTYSIVFGLASETSIAGEAVTWSGEVRDGAGESVEAAWDLASDRESLTTEASSIIATAAGVHAITATAVVGDQVLDASAVLTVAPAAADSVNLILDDSTIDAGTETGWIFTAEDAWGNGIEAAEPLLSAPDLTVTATAVGGTTVGFWEVTATLDEAVDVETLRIVAGPAAVLELELDDVELDVGDSATATVTVTDAWGNPSGAPYSLWVEGGRHEVALDRITFLEDGTYMVYAEVAGGPIDSVGPIVIDSSGPELFVTAPERGMFLDAAAVTVEGTALDGDLPAAMVETNGMPLSVGGLGEFAGDVSVDDGIQVLETIAMDASGHATTDRRAVLNGVSLPWEDEVFDGIQIRLEDGAGGLDTLSGLAEGLIDPSMIVSMIPDPAVDLEERWCEDIWLVGEVCYTLYAVTLSIDGATFGATTVDIDPLPTGLVRVEMVVSDPDIDWSADVIASEIPFFGSGSITADSFTIRVDVDPSIEAGEFKLDVANVYVEAAGFDFDWDSWLEDVAEFFGLNLDTLVQDLVFDALETAVVDAVPPIFEEVLGGFEIAAEFPILDNMYTLGASFADVEVDTFGITLMLDTELGVADWRRSEVGPGSYFVGYEGPSWLTERPGGTNLALSLDFINQLLYGLWGGGALSLELSGEELGLGVDKLSLLFPEAVGDLGITVDAMLPPIVVPGEVDMAELQFGDLHLLLTDEVGTVLLDAYAHGSAPMSLSSADGVTFTPEIGEPELSLDVVAPVEGASEVEGLLVGLVPSFLPLLTDSIVGIELPTIEGFGLSGVEVEPVGPDGGYLNLHGDLYEE
jgi:hypothetical protein